MELIEHDPGPLRRLEVVVSQESTPSVVFQRICEGESLRDVAKSWLVPVGRFTEWFTTQHDDLYDAALKVRADQLAHEALAVASTPKAGVITKTKGDGTVEVTEEDMLGHRKLLSDTMLRLAGKWDRSRYAEAVKIDRTITVTTDAGLVGLASELLARIAARQEKVIEHLQTPLVVQDEDPI